MLLNIVTKKPKPKPKQRLQAPVPSQNHDAEKSPIKRQARAGQKRAKRSRPSGGGERKRHGEKDLIVPKFVPDPDDYQEAGGVTDEAASSGLLDRKIIKQHNTKKFAREMFSSDVRTFEDLRLSPRLCEAVEAEFGFKRPTHIQAKAIPSLLTRTDVMFQSKTGSGKTLAFLLPVVDGLQKRKERLKRSDGTRCIIVAPTRE